MNWLEGFKRLKKVLIAIFIIVVVYFSWDQLQSEPWFQIERAKGGEQGYLISDTNEYAGKENEIELYFAPKVTAVANQWIANWKNTNFIFPEDKSLKEIKQMVKKNEGTDFV